MKSDKKSIGANSSAEHVEQHLQTLDNNDGEREQLYYSQEQDFSAEELATIINEARLNELLAQSDKFLRGLNGEIKDFDEGDELK
ncbi:MAG: hypothetical protein KA291_08695 [Psychrobacter sp.]|nr:hypothetical protein [Psychrobacter sp.]